MAGEAQDGGIAEGKSFRQLALNAGAVHGGVRSFCLLYLSDAFHLNDFEGCQPPGEEGQLAIGTGEERREDGKLAKNEGNS